MAAIHEPKAIGKGGREGQIVGDDDRSRTSLPDLVAQQRREHEHPVGIETDRGLVEEQQPTTAGEGARHRDALGLAAAEAGGRARALGPLAGQVHAIQPLFHWIAGIVGIARIARVVIVRQRTWRRGLGVTQGQA